MVRTSYQEGPNLEEKFALYLKGRLGYDRVKNRVQVPRKMIRKGREVDVVGDKYNPNMEQWKRVWLGLGVIGVLGNIGVMVIDPGLYATSTFSSWVLMSTFTVLMVLGGVGYFWSNKHLYSQCWAECKSMKTKCGTMHIEKFLYGVKDHNDGGKKGYNFSECFFVSQNGFLEKALDYARKHKVRCFQVEGGSYREVE